MFVDDADLSPIVVVPRSILFPHLGYGPAIESDGLNLGHVVVPYRTSHPPMTNYNRNPEGIGGFKAGQPSPNPGGRPKGSSAVQLRCLQYCGEAVDVLVALMRENDGSKSAALRLSAASQILDRGLGRAAQSVALDLNLTKKLDELSDDELIALRDRYAALSGAAPKLIEHLAEQEEGAPADGENR